MYNILQVHAVPEEEVKSQDKEVTKVGKEDMLGPILPKGKDVVLESSDDSSSHLMIASVQSLNSSQNVHNMVRVGKPLAPVAAQLLHKQLQHHQQQQQQQQQRQQQMVEDNPGSRGGPIITSVRGGAVLPLLRAPVPSRDYSRVPGPMASTPAARPPPSVDALLRDYAHITSTLRDRG